MLSANSKEIVEFVKLLKEKIDAGRKDKEGILTVKDGNKYIRIDVTSYGQTSVYAFINRANGDIMKPASYRAPAKHARGNIFADDRGLSCCGVYGVQYLRGGGY